MAEETKRPGLAGFVAVVSDVWSLVERGWPFAAAGITFACSLQWGWIAAVAVGVPAGVAVVWLLVARDREHRGSPGGRISWKTWRARIYPSRHRMTIEAVHRLEHAIANALTDLEATPGSCGGLSSHQGRQQLGNVLRQCKEVVRAATGADVAVHLKLFEHAQDRLGETPLDKALLRAVRRVPSDKEHALNVGPAKKNQPLLRIREDHERFVVVTGDEGKPARLRERYAPESKLKVNSAYCYVLDKSEHFWICNDLEDAVAKGNYYSTSKNWQSYYKCLAVCLVSPPISSGGSVPAGSVRGILVVDSLDKGVFEYWCCRQLIGYLGHRIWEYLRTVDEPCTADQRRMVPLPGMRGSEGAQN